eukprot:10144509-Alexandrium_andersonii.AAC.1
MTGPPRRRTFNRTIHSRASHSCLSHSVIHAARLEEWPSARIPLPAVRLATPMPRRAAGRDL